MVPDELHGSILTKTLPARPHMTTKEVCKIIAHKARITNPQDYALYRLVDGEGKFVFYKKMKFISLLEECIYVCFQESFLLHSIMCFENLTL